MPVVIVLNMLDVAKRRGIIIDAGKIAKILKCPVICASASKGEGKAEILDVLRNAKNLKQNYEEFAVNYGEFEPFILRLEAHTNARGGVNKRRLCVKALENDKSTLGLFEFSPNLGEFRSEQGLNLVSSSGCSELNLKPNLATCVDTDGPNS